METYVTLGSVRDWELQVVRTQILGMALSCSVVALAPMHTESSREAMQILFWQSERLRQLCRPAGLSHMLRYPPD